MSTLHRTCSQLPGAGVEVKLGDDRGEDVRPACHRGPSQPSHVGAVGVTDQTCVGQGAAVAGMGWRTPCVAHSNRDTATNETRTCALCLARCPCRRVAGLATCWGAEKHEISGADLAQAHRPAAASPLGASCLATVGRTILAAPPSPQQDPIPGLGAQGQASHSISAFPSANIPDRLVPTHRLRWPSVESLARTDHSSLRAVSEPVDICQFSVPILLRSPQLCPAFHTTHRPALNPSENEQVHNQPLFAQLNDSGQSRSPDPGPCSSP